ncbi:MAG: TonB-dependent receptor [Candidatus Omnitrophica bacterium]|nr:TonB-dependent receptor [Candidatus Omnitrophota bacterium]
MRGGWIVGLVVIGMGASTNGWAEPPSRLEEVVVTATRTDVPTGKLTKSVSVVNAEQIEDRHTPTVLEALREIPGVFIRQSGAIGRTTSAVMRGSLDKEVVVLLDGVPVNSPTLGNFNFSTLPADTVDRIEVLRGSASTLYGSDAIGGVINIITKRGEGPMRTTYQQEFGTQRTFREILTNQAAFGPVHYHLGVERDETKGLSTGDQVRLTDVTMAGGADLAKWLNLDVALHNNSSRVGIDDEAFRRDPNRLLTREELALSPTLTATPMDAWRQELRFFYHNDDTVDIDPPDPSVYQANGDSQPNAETRINTDRYGIDWIHHVTLGSWGVSSTGFQWKDDTAESRFKSTVKQWDWFFQQQLNPIDRLTLIGGVRLTQHSFFGTNPTTEASASYRIPVTETRLRANFSTGFRAPSLNELFFPNFGNPDIGPEKSRTFEVGAGQEWWDGRVGGDVAWYFTRVNNLIQTARLTSTTSQAQNIGRARMTGFELEAHGTPIPALRLSGTWTYTDAIDKSTKDKLVRIPANKVGLNVSYDFLERWRLNLHTLLVSHQEESVGTNARRRVKQYGRVDGSLTCRVTKNLEVYGRIENLLDRHYSEVLGFPTPGTLFFIGGKVEI